MNKIVFVANALGGTATTTSFTITLPETQDGDLILIEFCHRGTGDGSFSGTFSGAAFTQKHKQLFGGSAFSGQTYYSRATGNHSGQTVIVSSLTNSCAGICTIYRGALQSGDPLADATVVGEQNASGNETQAEITTATNNSWVVLCVVNSPDLAVAGQTCTSPGTLTERAERLSTGGTDTSIAHASAEKSTAGATGALNWTQTDAASGSWAYAIEPDPNWHAIAETNEDGFSGEGGTETNEEATPGTYWYIGGDGTTAYDWGGIYRSTGIPQGATILTATLRLTRHNTDTTGTTVTGDWYGYDVDSPADFSDAHTHRASDHETRTTASAAESITVSSTQKTSVSLVTIIQEIVDRAGFSGDIGVTFRSAGGVHTWPLADFSTPGFTPYLVITWEAGGAAATSPYYSSYYVPMIVRT